MQSSKKIVRFKTGFVSDFPLEAVRKHASAILFEKIFHALVKVENNESLASGILKLATFSHNKKVSTMSKTLRVGEVPYTHAKTFTKRMATLSVAKTATTLAVAGVVGATAFFMDVVPTMKERKKVEERFHILGKDFKETFDDCCTALAEEFRAEAKKKVWVWEEAEASKKKLEEEASKKNSKRKLQRGKAGTLSHGNCCGRLWRSLLMSSLKLEATYAHFPAAHC